MAHERDRGTPLRTLRTSLALGLVGALAGLLFATNAGLFAQGLDRRPQDLRDLVRDESARMHESAEEVSALRGEVDGLRGDLETHAPGSTAPDLALAAGRVAVAGPGVRVQLWDAPYTTVPEGFQPDDLVVHQQDIEAVINGLRAGGAEAISVQGHRLTAMTSIRCVGNVLLVDGRKYSPPYVIEAIGEPTLLTQAVLGSHSVQMYLYYAELVRLGWSLDEHEELHISGFDGAITLTHARVPGHEPYVPVDDITAPFPEDSE